MFYTFGYSVIQNRLQKVQSPDWQGALVSCQPWRVVSMIVEHVEVWECSMQLELYEKILVTVLCEGPVHHVFIYFFSKDPCICHGKTIFLYRCVEQTPSSYLETQDEKRKNTLFINEKGSACSFDMPTTETDELLLHLSKTVLPKEDLEHKASQKEGYSYAMIVLVKQLENIKSSAQSRKNL